MSDGFGSPPAKEMMSGFSVTLRISLMKDLGVLAILGANWYGLFVPFCDAMGDFMLRLITE